MEIKSFQPYNLSGLSDTYQRQLKLAITHDISKKLLDEGMIDFKTVEKDGKLYLEGVLNVEVISADND